GQRDDARRLASETVPLRPEELVQLRGRLALDLADHDRTTRLAPQAQSADHFHPRLAPSVDRRGTPPPPLESRARTGSTGAAALLGEHRRQAGIARLLQDARVDSRTVSPQDPWRRGRGCFGARLGCLERRRAVLLRPAGPGGGFRPSV